ncbi:MAG: pirin family protein [Nitrospirae bacterium]|nr:pirin family protein [Nitrospirota bacterium]
MYRKIEKIFKGSPFHMVGDGFKVSNYFPSATEINKRMSPFFLLDYHPPFKYSPTPNERRGVGPHPHQGIETVTIAFEGAVAHHDSVGNSGIIYPGDVQWMTAGGGILHSEYHEKKFARSGGIMHMMQIWVNLPKKHKLTAPKYQALTNQEIPKAELPSQGGIVRVISGEFQGTKGPGTTFAPVHMLDIRLKANNEVHLPTPKSFNTALIVLQGDLTINQEASISQRDAVLFKNDGDDVLLSAVTDSTVLFLSGEPIEEPIVHYGPFVMNTVDEINQAIEDYNAGKFGYLTT